MVIHENVINQHTKWEYRLVNINHIILVISNEVINALMKIECDYQFITRCTSESIIFKFGQ